jgi:hypothetical protein
VQASAGGGGGYGGYAQQGMIPHQQQQQMYQGGGGGGYNASTTMVVQVPISQLGAVFGVGGERIQEMRKHCGANIVVEDKNIEPSRPMRNVMIIGNEPQRQWGNYLVMLAIQVCYCGFACYYVLLLFW